MKKNWFYIFSIMSFVGMLFLTFTFFRGSGHASVGITFAKEYKINTEKSSLVKYIPVVPGQEVKKRDLLVELSSSQLEIEIDRLSNRIAVHRSEQSEKAKLADSKIAFLKADEGVEIEKINREIEVYESELTLNKQLIKEFSNSHEAEKDEANPEILKINALKKQRAKQLEAIEIKTKGILQENETNQKLLKDQILLLEREFTLLLNEKKKLSKYATADGVVENVYVKEGEQLDAFTPIISINPIHPTSVIGYLIGRKTELPVGSKVTVRAFESNKEIAEGKVIGYGAVVQLPDILQKSTAVKAFGKQVFIEISSDNVFATGEKVLIK